MSTATAISGNAAKLKSQVQTVRHEVYIVAQFLRDCKNPLTEEREREQLAKWLDKGLATLNEIAE